MLDVRRRHVLGTIELFFHHLPPLSSNFLPTAIGALTDTRDPVSTILELRGRGDEP